MSKVLDRLRDKLHAVEIQNFSLWLAFPVFVVVLSSVLAPTVWYGNEINYFDLANRWVNEDAYTTYHAVRDNTVGRLVSFVMMGASIEAFGIEGAHTFLGLLLLTVFPIAYFCLVRALDTNLFSATLVLSIFLISPQSLLAGEYIFRTIEPKSFAYLCVLFGLASAFSDRRIAASLFMAGAVYFHFLVGAFWGGAVIALYLISDKTVRSILRPVAVFLALSFPLFLAILSERIAGPSVSLEGSELTLNAIYAEIRNPHHIAPFVDGSIFVAKWLPGILAHSAVALGIGLWVIRSQERDKSFSIWVGGLNAYILLVTILAFLDRDTHLFSMFYMFRPSALILLLSLIWGITRLLRPVGNNNNGLVAIGLVIIVGVYLPLSIRTIAQATHGGLPLASMLSTSEAEMVDWIGENTSPGSIVMLEPLNDRPFKGEGFGAWVGMERLMGRPTLVNYKFVPTDKADLLRWYQLLQWRQSVFDGNCAALQDYPVAYLVARTKGSIGRLKACTELVWRGDNNAILQVSASESARAVPNP